MKSLTDNLLVILGLFSILTLFSVRYFLPSGDRPYAPVSDLTAQSVVPPAVKPNPIFLDPELERILVLDTAYTVKALDDELAALLSQNQYAQLRDRLLHLAAQAVDDHDMQQLGHVLSLLGQLSIEEKDLDAAEVYLMESLDVYQSQDDTVGSAQVYMQLGRAHLKSRQLARNAGVAYDRLLLGRWQLSKGEYAAAEQNFKKVVEGSLSMNRFGAAASAYYSLVRLYTESNDIFQAEQAAMEAARLYAASGLLFRARKTVEQLRQAGVEQWRLYEIDQEIERNYAEYESSVKQIARANDYRQLYNHYRSKGDVQRAWSLRLLASKSLKNVSKRAMYHRQPDPLALLYVSNDDMSRAENYFDIAKQTFDEEGLETLSLQTEKLKKQVF